ncbi:hypothetical protein RGU70_13400 [Herbaspirillum sp. RTI4]|uniref:hypothetical protein n=1 Tax=Herbaspirillum sp. RTI4 TaxID=3048640 RepID=UPI002AB5240D|nr:hypothetical protein [Herbaspirillum sp. RTI4]MDY7579311.1 hypothetical protein [Herbaspirillum sp. RTI4]MEA9980225.1 hypothetical protein [Herbaspirillum sp. RTI4]
MNLGQNRGKRLKPALARFASMLIEEAKDITGLTYPQLDEALGIEIGQAIRYSQFSKGKENPRAPHAAGIQGLENRVARLLRRTAHVVVVENNAKIGPGGFEQPDFIEGAPGDGLNLRAGDSEDFQLGYDGGWPTYRSLKADPTTIFCRYPPIYELVTQELHDDWHEMLQIYSWQWGVLWDRGLPWLSREAMEVAANTSIDAAVEEMTAQAMQKRVYFEKSNGTEEGRILIKHIAAAYFPSRQEPELEDAWCSESTGNLPESPSDVR